VRRAHPADVLIADLRDLPGAHEEVQERRRVRSERAATLAEVSDDKQVRLFVASLQR
jgi:hypothetical protein